MTAVLPTDLPGRPEPPTGRRRRMAYRRANWLLSGAGVALTLAGVSPQSPEVQAIGRALRAVNHAGGIDRERAEESPLHPSKGPRSGKSAG